MTKIKSLNQPGNIPGVLTVTKYEQPLQHHLHVQPPSSLKDTAPVLSFERLREIEIPWDKVFEKIITDSQRDSVTPLKEYFEQSWNLEDSTDHVAPSDNVIEISESNPPFYTVKFMPPTPPTPPPPVPSPIPPAPASPDQAQAVAMVFPVENGIVLKDGYNRHYLCMAVGGEEITKDDFSSKESYSIFWEKKIQGVELCYKTKESALKGYTKVEYIDLAEKFILDTWDQLKPHKDFDDEFQEILGSSSKKMIESAMTTDIDLDQINRIQQSVTSLSLRKLRIQRRLERLAQKAAELGYLLVLETQKVPKFPDDKAHPDIQAGQLYRQFKREYKWTTTIDRVECTPRRGIRIVTSFFGIESTEPRRWQEKKTHSQIIVDVQLVDVNDNALIEKIDELNKDHEVFVFDKTPRGYLTADGTSLREVMFRCERDEDFRCRCAVFIPVIEKALSGSQVIKGYHVFIAPFPGIVPVALPRLSIRESLSYRLAWQETQLGEVVNSINLAPGESRTITVRRSYEQETAYSQKRTTIFDLQESDTTDIATEMEREIGKEKQSGWNLAASQTGGASVPIEGISVDVSTSRSFGYNESIKSFNKTLTKVAKKASSSINRSYKDEVTTDTRQTTKISNYDEYTSTIKNINEGRTLNLLFYRLYNQYKSGLYVDDLQFLVTPSVEIIAGSGIHDSVSFDATEFDALLDEFGVSRLPFDMDDINELRYKRLVIKEFEDLLEEEYNAHVARWPAMKDKIISIFHNADKDEEKARKALEECEARGGSPQKLEEARKTLLEKTREHFQRKKEQLEERLRKLELMGNCVEEHDLQMLARGLYVDALVGAVPSTETYSERMREQVVALKMAEVALTQADAYYRESLAQHMVRNAGNGIVGIMPCRERNSLILALKFPLATGRWDLVLDGKKLREVPSDQLGNYMVNLNWDTKQKWLDDDGLMNRCLQLHNRDKGIVLSRI